MQNLKRLGAVVLLISVLGVPCFAGIIDSPPCGSPDPGIMGSPPCSAAPGQLETPPASDGPGIIQGPPASDYFGFAITLFDNAVFF